MTVITAGLFSQMLQNLKFLLNGGVMEGIGPAVLTDVPEEALPWLDDFQIETGPNAPKLTVQVLPWFEPVVSDTATTQELPWWFEPVAGDTGPVDPNLTVQELPFFEPIVSDTGPLIPADMVVQGLTAEELLLFEMADEMLGPPPELLKYFEPVAEPGSEETGPLIPADMVVQGLPFFEPVVSDTSDYIL